MPGVETLNAYVSDVAALTAATVDPQQSLTVRSPDSGSAIRLIGMWRKGTAVAPYRLRSNRMHDNVQGIRIEDGVSGPISAFDYGVQNPLIGNDKLTAETYDTATTNANLGLLVYYDSLSGSNGKLSTWDQVKPRILQLIGVSIDISAAATLSEWSAGDNWDVPTNLMKADYEYAILGYDTQLDVCSIAVSGPCTGSLYFGGPGITNPEHTRMWYARMSREYGLATIPIVKQADIGNTFAHQVDNAAGAVNTVSFLCAQLSS